MRQLTDACSASYHEARERFRRRASALGWSVNSHVLGSTDANDSELSIDWAATGANNPERTLILSSGLHGDQTGVRCLFVLTAPPGDRVAYTRRQPPPGQWMDP